VTNCTHHRGSVLGAVGLRVGPPVIAVWMFALGPLASSASLAQDGATGTGQASAAIRSLLDSPVLDAEAKRQQLRNAVVAAGVTVDESSKSPSAQVDSTNSGGNCDLIDTTS